MCFLGSNIIIYVLEWGAFGFFLIVRNNFVSLDLSFKKNLLENSLFK